MSEPAGPFRRLASEELLRLRTFRLRRDRVALPDGSERDFAVVEHPGCAVVVPVDEAGRVLLIRQYRYATGEVTIEVPAGAIDPGESAADCAARELAEETGLRAGRLEPLGQFYTTDGMSNELAHLFLARNLGEGEPDRQAGETIEPFWLPLGDAIRLIQDGAIRCGPTSLALLLAEARLRADRRAAPP